MPWNIIEPCGESATTQFGFVSGSLFQKFTAANIFCSEDELPCDPESLKIGKFSSDEYLGITVDNVLNFVTPDCESQAACYEFDANVLCSDCLQDGSLAVCATGDGKIHCIIGHKLISQSTGEMFEDGVNRAVVQMKLSEPIENSTFHDLWILLEDGQLMCKRQLDAGALKDLDPEDVSPAALLSVHSQVQCVPLPHPWAADRAAGRLLTAVPFGVCMMMEDTLASFEWADNDPACSEFAISLMPLPASPRRAAFLPRKNCLLLLDAEGDLSLFDVYCGPILQRWEGWNFEDFTTLPSLSNEDRTVLAVVRSEAANRVLEIRGLPDLQERTFSAQVCPGPVAMFPLAFDLVTSSPSSPSSSSASLLSSSSPPLGPLAFLSSWEPWESAEAGLAINVLMEVNPTAKMMRLLARRRFEEAEELAAAFKLDTQVILVHKMASQMTQPLDDAALEQFLACFEAIQVLPNHPDLVRACLGKTFPQMDLQRRFLQTLVTKLQTDGPISPEWNKAADLLEQLRTFEAWDPPQEFSVDSWSTFSRADPYNKFIGALSLGQVKNAFLLWDRHQLGVRNGFLRFGENAVEDLMSFAENFGLESPFVDWLLSKFLPVAVLHLPPSCLTVFANAYRVAVIAVEKKQPDRWPQLAISALHRLFDATSRDRVCTGNLASEQRAWLLSQLGADTASPLWELQQLLGRLERLHTLRERYGFELRLQEVGSANSASIAALLLEKELRFGRRLERALERRLRPFLRNEGLEEMDFLKDFVTDRVRRLRRETDAAEVPRVSEEAVSAVGLLPLSCRMRLLLDLAGALSLPWPAAVAEAVDAALADALRAGSEVAPAAHPLRGELATLRRFHEVHELLGRYGVALPHVKLDTRTIEKAIRIMVRRRLRADGGGLDAALLDVLEKIGSEVLLTPFDVRRMCLHQVISLSGTDAVLSFLDACSPDLRPALLRSALSTACDLLRAFNAAVEARRARAEVEHDLELALCLADRLRRCGDERAGQELAVLQAMQLLVRLREEDTWLDEVSDPRWAAGALRALLQAELRRLHAKGPCSDLRPPSALRLLSLRLRTGHSLPEDFDFSSAWLHEALVFGSWGLRGALQGLREALREKRLQDPVCWLRPLALRLLQAIEEEEEGAEMLRKLAEAWAEAEGLRGGGGSAETSSEHLCLRVCICLQATIRERAARFQTPCPEAEQRMLCRFSVECEDCIPGDVPLSELQQLLTDAFSFARSVISGAASDEGLALAERLLNSRLVLSCGWPLLHQLTSSGNGDPARQEALLARLRAAWLPRVLFDLLSARRLDPNLAYGIAKDIGFEPAMAVIEEVLRRTPNSHKVAKVVSYLTGRFGRATQHDKSLALGARFRLIAHWLHRLQPFKRDFGSKLLRGANCMVLEMVIEAAAVQDPPAELSVTLVCDLCSDFQMSVHPFLRSLLEKLLCWNPELVLKSPSSVARRLALAGSALSYLQEHSTPAELDSLSEWLKIAFEETDPCEYERLGFLLEHGPRRTDSVVCTELLTFLKSWRRVGPMSRKEHEMSHVFSEELALSPLAKTRLPFFAMLEAPEAIIEPEINPDNVDDLVAFRKVFKMTPDVMFVVAAKNLVASHVAWAKQGGTSTRLAWTGPAAEVDYAVWERLMGLLAMVQQPKLAFAGVQALVSATRSGWEHRMALEACDRFASEWLAGAPAGKERGLAQRVAERFKAKGAEVALEAALMEHRLATAEAMALLQRPADLVQHLLEGPPGPEADARFAAAEQIAALSSVDGASLQLRLLKKWLRCADDPMAGDDDLDVTFNYRDLRQQLEQGSSEERWQAPGADEDLQRAVALLRRGRGAAVRHFVEEVAFGLEEGSLPQLRALSAMLLAWPLQEVRAAADRLLSMQLRFARGHTPPLHDFLGAVIYVCRLEPLRPMSLELFLAADKADLVAQWLADRRATQAGGSCLAALALQLLLEFRPAEPQLWARALRRAWEGRAGCVSRGVELARQNLPPAAWRRVEQEAGAEVFWAQDG